MAASIAALAIGGAGAGYIVHLERTAQTLATQNEEVIDMLAATGSALDTLAAKVNNLASRVETQPAPSPPPTPPTTSHRVVTPRGNSDDRRLNKLQSQVDAQGKQIQETRNDLASTRGDLSTTRTELTGSIAHTHEELVLLQKRDERNYYEFDVQKSKQFYREGPVGICLRKANTKHQYADLELMLQDQKLSQKHVNLYQPVMFYRSDNPEPIEVVINTIGKDHIHGYVSAPKYRQSELASKLSNRSDPAYNSAQTMPNTSAQPMPRDKLPSPH